tara:strand:+ start:962 stop:1138 length:177 start_codon:yes stop_codon:yes gene_type:complete
MPKNNVGLDINKGIELMLRRARPKDPAPKPKGGFGFKRSFSLLKRKYYFNLEFRWERR